MRLTIQASKAAREFIEQIVAEMLSLFPITRDEAVGRINDHWGHLEYIGDRDLIFHETAEYWAKTIYYGKDSHWWLGEEGLPPVPYRPRSG
jgi:hypothetical protein